MSEKILRAALYPRVSTEEQKLKGFSIDAQMDALREYCERNKIKIVDFYNDEGISGAKPPMKRPGLKRLLDDVEAGKIDIILFTKLDRWFRSVKEYFKVQEILDKHGVQWKAIHEDYDTTTANGQMAITIFLAVAQNERDRTSERINAVLDYKRKNKEACFGGPQNPLGYIKQKDENGVTRLVKDPETQEAMQAFWDRLMATHNLYGTIKYMEHTYGIKRVWYTWNKITHNQMYCGIYKGVENFCEPYVDISDFTKYNSSRSPKATPTGRIYIFRSLLTCSECGRKMAGNGQVRGKYIYKAYSCSRRGISCDNHSKFSERRIEKQLLNKIKGFLNDEIARAEIEFSKPKPQADIKKLKERRRRLEIVYMAGNKSDEEYLREDAELKEMIEKAEAELEVLPDEQNIAKLKNLLETDFLSLYGQLDDSEKHAFWSGLLSHIDIDEKTREIVGVTFRL